jgi:tetratricopeptide (TPR) repeat protein
MSQDYYEILQVHPRADQDAIAAAYARLRDLYDPAKLDGVAEEIAAMARQKRDAIERAYAVLGDAGRRAAYDAEQAALRENDQRPTANDQRKVAGSPSAVIGEGSADELLDYQPLPPARGAERPRGFDTRPTRPAASGRQPHTPAANRWVAPVAFAGLFVLILAIGLALTGGGGPPAAAPVDQYEAGIASAQQAIQQNPNDPKAWIEYGNALYDSVNVVRENTPDSPLYQQRLPRWLQATQAYTRALALDPGNAAARADLGASACFYGAAAGDQSFVRSGTAEARRAAQLVPDDPRVLFNLGHCLISAQPPQVQQAVEQWKRVVAVAPPGSSFAAQAQQLIAQYDR